jgi:hypothetical protein
MNPHSTYEIVPATSPWSIWTSTFLPDETFSETFFKSNQALAAKKPRSPAKHPVLSALENVKVPVNNGELARLMGVSDGEASKRWREVAHLLEVARVGKERRIALK